MPGPRIIPARAGFTAAASPGARSAEDHPRSRGVYAAVMSAGSIARGSSPLARGLRLCDGRRPPHVRIIPARAGFTVTACRRRAVAADHPRSRGVYRARFPLLEECTGSSPLARGLQR